MSETLGIPLTENTRATKPLTEEQLRVFYYHCLLPIAEEIDPKIAKALEKYKDSKYDYLGLLIGEIRALKGRLRKAKRERAQYKKACDLAKQLNFQAQIEAFQRGEKDDGKENFVDDARR